MNNTIPIWEKQLLTIDEAALYTNIGQNRISELLKSLPVRLLSTLVERS